MISIVLLHIKNVISINFTYLHKPLTLAAYDVSHIDSRDLIKDLAWEPRWLDPITGGAGGFRTFLYVPVEPHSSSPLFSLSINPPPRFSFPSTGVGTRSAYVVYKPACFLAGVYTHFLPPYSPPRRSVTQPPLSFASLSIRPHRKEIKPHLTRWLSLSRTTVVLRGERSWNELAFSLASSFKRRKNPVPGEKGWENTREKRVVGEGGEGQAGSPSGERAARMTEGSLPLCAQLNFNFVLDIDAMLHSNLKRSMVHFVSALGTESISVCDSYPA